MNNLCDYGLSRERPYTSMLEHLTGEISVAAKPYLPESSNRIVWCCPSERGDMIYSDSLYEELESFAFYYATPETRSFKLWAAEDSTWLFHKWCEARDVFDMITDLHINDELDADEVVRRLVEQFNCDSGLDNFDWGDPLELSDDVENRMIAVVKEFLTKHDGEGKEDEFYDNIPMTEYEQLSASLIEIAKEVPPQNGGYVQNEVEFEIEVDWTESNSHPEEDIIMIFKKLTKVDRTQ